MPGRSNTYSPFLSKTSSLAFEDVERGNTHEFEDQYEITETEIIEFGKRSKPWVQHIDAEVSDESEYVERLTAGTLLICGMGLRLLYDAVLADASAVDTVAVEDAGVSIKSTQATRAEFGQELSISRNS